MGHRSTSTPHMNITPNTADTAQRSHPVYIHPPATQSQCTAGETCSIRCHLPPPKASIPTISLLYPHLLQHKSKMITLRINLVARWHRLEGLKLRVCLLPLLLTAACRPHENRGGLLCTTKKYELHAIITRGLLFSTPCRGVFSRKTFPFCFCGLPDDQRR